MATNTKHSEKVIVLSFAARDGDPFPRDRRGNFFRPASSDPDTWGPTLTALGHPRSTFRGRVERWYYLCHPATADHERDRAHRQKEVAADTVAAIQSWLPAELQTELVPVELRAKGPPNDYAELYELVVAELREVRRRHPQQEIVLAVSHGAGPMQSALFLAGAVRAVEGPLSIVQVERAEGLLKNPGDVVKPVTLSLDTVYAVARATIPVAAATDDALLDLYARARSPKLRDVLALARRVASVDFPLLLRGERGVGKTTLAAVIRALSGFRRPERDASWPAVSCGQFPDPEKLRLELCGAERGAFTGVERRPGLLHLADGDTLFLDEIHHLSKENQAVDRLARAVARGAVKLAEKRVKAGHHFSSPEEAVQLLRDLTRAGCAVVIAQAAILEDAVAELLAALAARAAELCRRVPGGSRSLPGRAHVAEIEERIAEIAVRGGLPRFPSAEARFRWLAALSKHLHHERRRLELGADRSGQAPEGVYPPVVLAAADGLDARLDAARALGILREQHPEVIEYVHDSTEAVPVCVRVRIFRQRRAAERTLAANGFLVR